MQFIKVTQSLCPECLNVVPATLYEKDGKVFMTKSCPVHGDCQELYWGDYNQYMRAGSYADTGTLMNNPRTLEKKGCPYDCGVCTNHKSTTTLGIIDVTNRCNLRCPICFAHAGAAGYLYEPTFQQIRGMMENLMANDPVWTPALQFSGGEPTVREDLPELVELAKDTGFVHVEVDSNGIKMAESPEYCEELKMAGVDSVYLQFDGVTPKPYINARGFNLLPIKLRAIENLKNAGFFSIILVPVVVKGVNDDQLGDIIRFAVDNMDCVRGVNFQPVSMTGRINREKREAMRITIPEVMRNVEIQTDGFIKQSDWYPVPSVKPLTDVLSTMKKDRFVDFCAHPHCGMGTYLFLDEDKVQPITRLLNVDQVLESLKRSNEKLENGDELLGKLELTSSLLKNLKFKTLSKYVSDVVLHSDYLSLNRMHHKMILIGSMHFMDPYNFDLDRVQHCVIHYSTPDGRIIPFCTMNTIHRESVERMYAQPITKDNLTPLYDVEALTRRILEEEKATQDTWFLDYIEPTITRGPE
ncbi:radical SAM protein [Candidatus Bathyarchaeota archaeon]|nr:radical SAM protein [Candidatus Bathyarchaeota archaeon]